VIASLSWSAAREAARAATPSREPRRGTNRLRRDAEALDEDMARRIARHRAERPPHWTTIEVPLELVARLEKLEGTCDAFVVDCLTLWVANRLLRGDDDEAILDEANALATLIGRRRRASPWCPTRWVRACTRDRGRAAIP